jgi:hypothetical protein
VGARVPSQQFAEGVVDRIGERLGDAHRQRHAQPVAEPSGILDSSPARAVGQPHGDHPVGGLEVRQPAGDRLGVGAARGQLGGGQRPERSQQIAEFVRVARAAALGETLQLRLGAGEGLGIEQVGQRETLAGAEQVGEQAGVERERRGPLLCQRRVAFVEELGHVPEQQRRRERRGPGGLDADDRDLA